MKKLLFIAISVFVLIVANTPAPLSESIDKPYDYLACIEKDDLHKFLQDIAFYESSNDYSAVNRFGYLGKYQFGMTTLRGLGYEVTRKEFLNSPTLQEEAMLKLLDHNRNILSNYIVKYEGKYVHGIKVTESGLLAAAHLVGPGRVKKFLYTGVITRDGNNTELTSYMEKFQDYSLDSSPFEGRMISALITK